MAPKKHKHHSSSSSSSSSDEEQDVATSHDDETAELNKLILTNSEPVYDKPTMNINDTKIVFGKNKLLPVNRNIKNNFPVDTSQETSPAVASQEKPPKQSPVEKPKHKHTRKHKKKHKDNSSDEEVNMMYTEQPPTQFMPSVPIDNIQQFTPTNDIITVYPDYNGPYKVNKKVFRICYITIVAVMLITLVFIIMLQNFRRYLMITQTTNQSTVQGGSTVDETPHIVDDEPQTQAPNDDLFSDVFKSTRLRDSKGRFVKMC